MNNPHAMRGDEENRKTLRELADHVLTLENKIRLLDVKLKTIRRMYADLVAAARAALTANAEGETDPWAYLRDELPEAPSGHPLSRNAGPRTGRGWCR